MSITYSGWITACVAHYRCQRYIKRAVESLLDQSYPWVRVIVINDGDPVAPWRELASIRDARLVRFNLKANHGCFFCWEVARRATPDHFFMMQDADDWAAPDRAAALLSSMLEAKSDLAVSAQPQFCDGADLITGPEQTAYLARALLFSPIIDRAWIAHQIIDTCCNLRVASILTTGKRPRIVALVN